MVTPYPPSFYFEDEYKQAGSDLVRQCCRSQARMFGDGTTYSAIIMANFCKLNYSSEEIEEIDEAIRVDLKRLIEEQASPATKPMDMYAAIIASNNNLKIAEKVCEAVRRNGVDGFYSVEVTHNEGIEIEEVNGFGWDNGYVHPYCVNTSNGSCELKNPNIFIADYAEWNSEVQTIANTCLKSNTPLVIIGQPTEDLINQLIFNKQRNGLQSAVVSPSGSGFTRDGFYQDLKTIVKQNDLNMGSCKKLIARSHSCIIEYDQEAELESYIESVKNQETKSFEEEEYNKKRVSRLRGKSCKIKVGDNISSTLRCLKDQTEDTIMSVLSAVKSGVVRGGGLTLFELSKEFTNKKLAGVLCSPLIEITRNDLNHQIISSMDIVDSADVVYNSVLNGWKSAKNFIKSQYVLLVKNNN